MLLKEDAKFCGSCGTPVVVEAPAPVVEAPAPVVEAPTPVVEAPAPVVEAPAPVYVAPTPIVVETPAPAPVAQTYVPTSTPSRSIKKIMTEQDLPEEYRPMGAWSYVGLQLLFTIPIVGLVFLIIFTFKRSNLNRRAFARSYWCWLALVGVVLLTMFVIVLVSGSRVSAML